jgi:hypothetical protein
LIADNDYKSPAIGGKLGAAAAAVLHGVAGNFGNRCREANLILPVESEQLRDLAGPLPRQNNALFAANVDRQ